MVLNSEIIQLNNTNLIEVCVSVAQRVKSRRLELNLTQSGLASRAGVNIETYRKFERSGEISFFNIVKIGFALNMVDDFTHLFAEKQYQSIDELLKLEGVSRKRGKRK